MTSSLENAKPGDRIEVIVKGTISSVGPDHLYIDLGSPDGLMYLSPVDLASAEVVIKPALPKWQDGDVVIGFDHAYMMEGAFRRTDGQWFNEHAKGREPRTDEAIEKGIEEHGFRALVAEGRPVAPEPEATADDAKAAPPPHEFVPHFGLDECAIQVDGQQCGHSLDHSIHGGK